MDEAEEMSAALRAATALYLLYQRESVSTGEFARELGMTRSGAWKLMNKLCLSRRFAITQIEERWIILNKVSGGGDGTRESKLYNSF